ncbi:MAG: sugar transferase [Clostridia bacterium]|nr:sugar transferase [Clostridia bacterium]
MYIKIKWTLDRVCAFVGIIVMSPVFLITAILVASDRMGNIIFKQPRVGKDRKIFMIYKFRTMVSTRVEFDVDKAVIGDNNGYLTKVGRFLRKTKLDELPQLYNILKGDMSFIGPRPLLYNYLESYEKWELRKFDCLPGLSGLAQIKGNGHLSKKERSYYDVVYSQKINFLTDCEIFFKTIGVVVFGENCFVHKINAEELEALARKYS